MTYWLKRQSGTPLLPGLAFTFIVFWVSTVGFPAFLSAHPLVSHDYVYPLLIGIAAAISTTEESDGALRASRNGLFVFMLVGLLIIPFNPILVLDRAYTQGLLPGVPRFAGLASHPVTLGLLAQLALLCLLAQPFRRVWLNRFAWVTGLTVLFLAQSKMHGFHFLCALLAFIWFVLVHLFRVESKTPCALKLVCFPCCYLCVCCWLSLCCSCLAMSVIN